ncbi:MAG: (2Fe-2S)-binding protein [Betaproteobacteria bacterium]|nr:MAG: (2Fe-2S)-binding protein [Betaproteobacteria bacterium]
MTADTVSFRVNGVQHLLALPPETPLLYILRNDLKLKGTRFGCGLGQCGACTVLVDGRSVQSCDVPLWSVAGKSVTTVEGLGGAGRLHPLQQAILDEQAAQCGYCLNGVLMSAAALLAENRHPTEAQIRAGLDRNLCRCGTHARIVRAIQRAAKALAEAGAP